jgi:uncharacterized protein (DUF1697 family)
VNVGARTQLKMADLRQVVEGLGYENVRTYINSGNVLFRTSDRSRDSIAAEIRTALAEFNGRDIPVMVRSRADMARIAGHNPFPDANQAYLHVAFLSAAPSTADVTAMMALFDGHPERAEIRGSEAYVDFPNGAGRSKIDFKRVEKAAVLEATARNWRTVNTLLQKLDE